MSGYLEEEPEEVPMSAETRVGSAVVVMGAALAVLFTLVTIDAFPAVLGRFHGKVSPVLPSLWLMGGMFIIRAGINSFGERVAQRWLRLIGWGVVGSSTAMMIAEALL
jgi:hypothetical protein